MAGILGAPRRKQAFLNQVTQQSNPNVSLNRKLLVLAVPTNTDDITDLYDRFFLHSLPYAQQRSQFNHQNDLDDDDEEELPRGFANGLVPDIMDQRVCLAFGQITKAAVEKSPLLIITEPGIRVEHPQFIYMNTVDHFISEVELGLPGTFAFRQGKVEHRFSAASSLEYQRWETAFIRALDIVVKNKQNVAVFKRRISDVPNNFSSTWSDTNESRNSYGSFQSTPTTYSANNNFTRNSSSSINTTPSSYNSTTSPGSAIREVSRKSLDNFKNKVMGLKAFGMFKQQQQQHQQQSDSTLQSTSAQSYTSSYPTPTASPLPETQYTSSPYTSTYEPQKTYSFSSPPTPLTSQPPSTYQQSRTIPTSPQKDLPTTPHSETSFSEEVLSSLLYDHSNGSLSRALEEFKGGNVVRSSVPAGPPLTTVSPTYAGVKGAYKLGYSEYVAFPSSGQESE
ncbi:hypothetical protein HDU79_003417 [Rhizoclosmatium sp. JEL0117]|nr:hypothetical protein HDU79_003417 [Rhizoclosmatium sp. JEL0117]